MNYGPEFIAQALQEWYTGSDSGTAHIPPESHWENQLWSHSMGPYMKLFASAQEEKLLAEQQLIEYNLYKTHSALQGCTPLEVLQQWRAA